MNTKDNLKQKSILLRKQGMTYSEIMRVVPVAKSTISLWLRDVGLSATQKQSITDKKIQAQKRGALAQKNKRLMKQEKIIESAKIEIGQMTLRELWLVGTALYWAEGTKEKKYRTSCMTSFSNSDPKMISLFIKWLTRCVKIPIDNISFDLYIHKSHKNKVNEIIKEWGTILHQPLKYFRHVYLKKNKIKTKRKKVGDLYIGLLRVNIKASTDLNRKISGWIDGITEYWGIV